jgi:hypothetical protein
VIHGRGGPTRPCSAGAAAGSPRRSPGQDIARQWLAEHLGYLLRSVKCSVAGDPEALRDRIESPRA